MVNKEFSESISEVLDILNHMERSYTDKIPEKFKEFLENNKSENYIPNLNHSQKLDEMNLKDKTKDILAIIYINYWCTDEEKVDYIKILSENEKKYQAQLRKRYNPDNIFKENNKNKEIQEKTIEEVSIEKYKESIFRRIMNKIKSFLKGKK